MSSVFGSLFSKKSKKPAAPAAEIVPVTVVSTGRVNGGEFDVSNQRFKLVCLSFWPHFPSI